MIYKEEHYPQIRDCDADGAVGPKGYFHYFQDSASTWMSLLGLGNNIMPVKYGMNWVYSKYKLEIYKKATFFDELTVSSWVSRCDRIRVYQDMEIKKGEEVYCRGRLECCVFDLSKRQLRRVSDVPLKEAVEAYKGVVIRGIPEGAAFRENPEASTKTYPEESEAELSLPAFLRHRTCPPDAEKCGSHRVVYTDLDNSMHMNNQHYIELFLNAFEPGFYEKYMISDVEIHYLSQTYFGDEIEVFRSIETEEDGTTSYHLFAVKGEETVTYGKFRTRQQEQ